jgi:hypothetical protein
VTDRIIVATFNDTNAAYDAASAIKGLKDAGVADFKLKTGVMIKKDDRGNVVLLESKDRHLLGTAVGTVTGALIAEELAWADLSIAVRGLILIVVSTLAYGTLPIIGKAAYAGGSGIDLDPATSRIRSRVIRGSRSP